MESLAPALSERFAQSCRLLFHAGFAANAGLHAVAQKCDVTLAPVVDAEHASERPAGYLDVAAQHILQALRHTWEEIDALPSQPGPEAVCGCRLRRRLLELRLLLDFYAFAYDPDLLKLYREVINKAYERVGLYQDVQVARQLLGEDLEAHVVDQRQVKMSLALAPLRSADVREALIDFVSFPDGWLHQLQPKQLPHLWSQAATRPTLDHDAVGNLAMLGRALLRRIHAEGLLVDDILDPEQQARFHDIRKAARSVLTLTDMFSATRDGLDEARAVLVRLVHSYGEVRDCVIAHEAAMQIGQRVNERVEALRAAFTRASAEVRGLLADGAYDALIQQLDAIEREHCQAALVPMAA